MTTEQDRTLKGLQVAVQMETDGKKFYRKASEESGNGLGKKLLQSLADEEDIHRRKFEEIYDAVRSKKAWPITDFQADGGRGLRTIFARASKEKGVNVKALATELDAVQTAMAMENKTHDFYIEQGKNAAYKAERDFYGALAIQEREHHRILLDYYEYLKDPAGWFINKEPSSLDGG